MAAAAAHPAATADPLPCQRGGASSKKRPNDMTRKRLNATERAGAQLSKDETIA